MSEHLTKDGTPDKRFKENRDDESTTQEDQSNGNNQSSNTTGTTTDESSDGVYKPSEHDGKTKSGEPDKRMNPEHGFGGDHERAVEAGRKGGEASYENDRLTS